MTLSVEIRRRIREYLDEVEENLEGRTEPVRKELIKQLESHICDALLQSGRENPTEADLEIVLSEMDTPDSYRISDESDAPAANAATGGHSAQSAAGCPVKGGGGGKWFILALCFLLLNAWAVWKVTRVPEGAAPVVARQPEAPHPEPLRLMSASMASFDASENEAVIRLEFNAAPAPKLLEKFVSLSEDAEGKNAVGFQLVGEIKSSNVLIKTYRAEDGLKLVVKVNHGLPAASDIPALAADQQMVVELRSGFEPVGTTADSPAFGAAALRVGFGKTVETKGADDFVEVEPPVKFAVEYHYGGCLLSGDFLPGIKYAVTFKKGLKATDGTPLARDVVREIVFPDRSPALSIAVEGRYLSPLGALNVPVVAMNIRECDVSVRQVCPENVVFLANGFSRNWRGSEGLETPAVTNHIVFPDTPNRENKFYVNLRQMAGPAPKGVYRISVTYKIPGNSYSRQSDHLVAVTDLGISAKTAKNGVWAWVNSLRTAQPATNTEVVLYARNNQVLGRGQTDAQGLVFIQLRKSETSELDPSLVTARLGGDLSYLPLSKQVDLRGAEGDAYLGEGNEAFLFTDRGVYRPGETLHVKALVRDASLNPPPQFPVIIRIIKPDGRVFRDLPVTLSPLGAAEISMEIPAYLPTGGYTVKVVMPGTFAELGSTGVSVEEFVPPQIAVTLSNLPKRVNAGTSFPALVSARHLFGRPASGLPVSADVTFGDEPFKPEGWTGYRFGDSEKASFGKTVKLGDESLDDNGQHSFTVLAPSKVRPIAALRATVSATVSDSGGRAVSDYGKVSVDVYPFYVGLKPARVGGHVKVGTPLSIAVVAVKPDGMAFQPDSPLLVTVERVQWTSVMKRNNGRYAWQSERVKTKVGEPVKVMLAKGEGDYAFTAERAGEYIVTVTDPFSGSSSSQNFFAAPGDEEWVGWAKDKPAEVQLSLDREDYAPGDIARLAVKAPFTGPALLTVESDRVLEHRLVNLTANTAEFAIEVKREYGPNVHCVMSLIRPATAESVWSAHRAAGSAVLKVVPPGHSLDVTIEAPKQVRPQGKLPVTVKVADGDGKPVAGAELVVMAVDEGICMLTEFVTPDPLEHFLRTRGLGVVLADLYGDLMPICEDTSDATVSHTGGGGGEMLGRRLNPIKANRFKPVALWASGAMTESNGVAQVSLDVPEFTGELRVTAVVFGRSVFGAAKAPVTVKRPLVVQAGLPRFLAPGDRCVMSLAVFNETGSAIEAKWRVTCGGPLSAAVSEGSLPMNKGGSATVPVTLKAGAVPGKALCSVEVSAGVEIYSETFQMAIRPILAADTRTVSASLKPGQEVRVATPADWLPGTEYYEAWISGQPDVKLNGGLAWLLRYPYGCCEQTTSSAFPLLYLADLVARTRPVGLGDVDTKRFVMAGIYRLLTMQRESGGFAPWPDYRTEEQWISIYASHFLVEAKKAGYAVPDDRLAAALGYLRGELDGARQESRAYVCHVLALAGKPEHGWMARLIERADDLSASERAHLAAALMAAGKPREALKLLNELGLPEKEGERDGLESHAGDIALALSAWLDIEPGNAMVSRLVHELEGLRVANRGWWSTTQENAVALMALGKFARLTKPDRTPFEGELLPQGGASIVFKSDKDLRWASKEAGASKDLRIVNRGPGTCWYGVRMEGVPTVGTVTNCDAGVSIRREFLDHSGKPMDLRTIKQGDLAVVKLTIDPRGEAAGNLVIEDLIPAGLEIENPVLATSKILPWVTAKTGWCIHREIRDDRLLLFTGNVPEKAEYFYTVRAVTPGVFTLPPVRVEAMYRPEVRSVNGAGTVEVR